MPIITETLSFKLLKVVLSQKGVFSVDEVFTQLKKEGVNEDTESIKKALKNLRDNWVIIETGSFYSVGR